MKNLSVLTLCYLFLFITNLSASELNYKQPPPEITKLVDIERAPIVITDDKTENMLLLYRDNYKTMKELSEPEMRLGGLRINPKTNIGSRVTYYKNIKLHTVANKSTYDIKGLPKAPRLSNFKWSKNQSKMAFTHTGENGVELWYVDLNERKARQLTEGIINANMRDAINWFNNDNSILIKVVAANRKKLIPSQDILPTGPTVSVSDGAKAQNRTYQDLLKNPIDEKNFEQLATSELYQVSLKGKKKRWKSAAMYTSISFSPDEKYVTVTYLQRPFSYLVPYYRFPQKTDIYTDKGKLITTINDVPLTEEIPKGFMSVRKGKRNLSWRADKPATITWVEALDQGDPKNMVEYRDEFYQLPAPFNGTPESLFKTKDRFSGLYWGNDENAIFVDYWWNTRNVRTSLFNPSDTKTKPIVLNERNYQDQYSNPGSLLEKRNQYGKNIIDIQNGNVFLLGDGFTAEGQFPFIDKYNLKTLKKDRLYQSKLTDKVEEIIDVVDMKNNKVLVRVESPTEYPNYYIRDIQSSQLDQITAFDNPFNSIQNIHKEVVTYKRDDGVELSATLYLPAGYDRQKKKKLPMILWAYPTEFKDKNSASQNTTNPNEFIYPSYGSMIYWVTRGYAVLDDASFPIIGEGKVEPNDTFIKQLVANAKAAIDAIDAMGYIDRNRVAVAGHSYGAFMTANLLSHSDLFAAGIARSGAYNRTLTPFGFQAEERSYWEAPHIYNDMSPFMSADKMKYPLLLIHGAADNNSGTYPLQSERYFNALKGLGATARLVMLPKESHGYRAKESILHMLWEQDQWLEKHVKNKE